MATTFINAEFVAKRYELQARLDTCQGMMEVSASDEQRMMRQFDIDATTLNLDALDALIVSYYGTANPPNWQNNTIEV